MGLVATVGLFCRMIRDDRTKADTFGYLTDEVTELEEEIVAETPGEDGIFGEAIDVLINCIDLIQQERPGISLVELEAEVHNYAAQKCRKWQMKVAAAQEAAAA